MAGYRDILLSNPPFLLKSHGPSCSESAEVRLFDVYLLERHLLASAIICLQALVII